jgi:lysyl-tRNA synthetase class 2
VLLQVFRNEGVSSRHNPEFTSVEVYQAYADYSDMMDLTEALLRTAALAVNGTTSLSYQGVDIDLGQPFRRVTMNDLVKEKTGEGYVYMAWEVEAGRTHLSVEWWLCCAKYFGVQP